MTHDSPPGEGDREQIFPLSRTAALTHCAVYRRRSSHFAIKFIHAFFRIGAAKPLSPSALVLLLAIVEIEDHLRYPGPVPVHRAELLRATGMSANTLDRARVELVTAGWLAHRLGDRGEASKFFVAIPKAHERDFGHLFEAAQPDPNLGGCSSPTVPITGGGVAPTVPISGVGAAQPDPNLGGYSLPTVPMGTPKIGAHSYLFQPQETQESAPAPPAAARRKKTAKNTEPKPPTSPHAEAVGVWCELWAAKYGITYTFARGKDAKSISSILAAVGGDVAKFRGTVVRYLASPDGWLAENRHPLGTLAGQVNKYKPTGATAASPTRASECQDIPPLSRG